MAKIFDSFVFYRSFFEATKTLNDKDKLAVFNAIFGYVFEKKENKLTGVPEIIWTLIKPNIDSSIANKVAGSKGGRPRKKRGVFENEKGGFLKNKNHALEETKSNVDVDVDVNENGEVSEKNSYRQKAFELIQQTGRLQASPVELENLVAAVKFGCTKKTVKNLLKRRPDIANFNASWTVDELIAQKRIDDKEKNELAFPF